MFPTDPEYGLRPADSDCLLAALRYAGGDCQLAEPDIERVLTTLIGEPDGYAWHWLVRLQAGGYAYLVGRCDYTGWD
jgi:hypothetical protein